MFGQDWLKIKGASDYWVTILSLVRSQRYWTCIQCS